MERRRIRVIIADDHSVFRTGLKTFLSLLPGIELIAEVSNGQELVQKTLELEPDVILTDVDMPVMSGIQATKELCKRIPFCRVIALSVHAREEPVLRMLEAGAMGYILKSADTEEIKEAIITVDQYKPYFCKTTTDLITEIVSRNFKVPARVNIFFTDREKQIIQLICCEHTSKAIAHTLSLSKRTIEGHRTRIMDKIGAKSVAGIITYAINNGLYKSDDA